MEEYPLKQSSWGRAKQETLSAFHTLSFWVVEMISGPLVAVGMYFAIPSFVNPFVRTIVPIAAFSIWMLAVLGGIFLLSLVLAPYKQRNEARKLLLAKPPKAPISNRNELIRALNQVQEAGKTFIWEKEKLNQMSEPHQSSVFLQAQNEAEEAYIHYQQAEQKLDEEGKVAGEAFQAIISSFQNLVKLHVWIRYYEHDNRPDWSVVLTEFDNAVKRTVKAIDDIS